MRLINLVAVAALALSSFSAFAALDESDVVSSLAGQYRLKQGERSLLFVIRSSGAIEIPENNDYPYAQGSVSFSYTSDADLHDGLPVAHIVIGVGSDEDLTDYHILLTARQDMGDERVVQLAAKFTTFNDGPNEMSDLNVEGFEVLRYNRSSRRFEELK